MMFMKLGFHAVCLEADRVHAVDGSTLVWGMARGESHGSQAPALRGGACPHVCGEGWGGLWGGLEALDLRGDACQHSRRGGCRGRDGGGWLRSEALVTLGVSSESLQGGVLFSPGARADQ